MIKKKAYEKQNMKTLYDNQGELVRKQNDFSNYGIENEYGFSDKRLDAKLQARNINVFKFVGYSENARHSIVTDKLDVGKYLVCGTWTITGPLDELLFQITDSDNYYVLSTLYSDTNSSGSICMPFEITEQGNRFAVFPDGSNIYTTTCNYNILFISL